MTTIQDIYEFLNTLCPYELAEEWDNPGLNVGRRTAEAARVWVALDLTLETVAAAREAGCSLIITHHPLLFSPERQINDDTATGRRILALAESGIAHIACHTNWDAAEGGVNCILAALCGLKNDRPFAGLGRIGDADTTLTELVAKLKKELPAETCIGIAHHEEIRRIALIGGSGGSVLEAAIAEGCDTFVTGEAKHDHALLARECGINLLMLGHYETEYVSLRAMAGALRKEFPALTVLEEPRRVVLERL